MNQVKVTYKNETKKFKKPSDYQSLLMQTVKAFGAENLPQRYKFFYMDSDGDLISINCQEDLDEAYEGAQTQLKFIIEENSEGALYGLDPTMSVRSSINLSRIGGGTQNFE
jgi:hypothetical protein